MSAGRLSYSSLFMRQVCFSMCMVDRSVELVSTSRTSSCLSSSVSASRARFFSCISICKTHTVQYSHTHTHLFKLLDTGPQYARTTEEQDTNKRRLNTETYRNLVSSRGLEHADHMWRGVKTGSGS